MNKKKTISDYAQELLSTEMNYPSVGCGCIGPQPGYPRCPCMMAGVVSRNGRWIQLEVDLGPVIGDYE